MIHTVYVVGHMIGHEEAIEEIASNKKQRSWVVVIKS